MPLGCRNVSRSEYVAGIIHGMSLRKASWTNGLHSVVCNSAEEREACQWEPRGRRFPGWAGVISPWGRAICFIDDEGDGEPMVDGLLWLSYPEKSSKVKTDLTRDVLWALVEPAGWRPVTQVSIDEVWSAMRFRPVDLVKKKK